MIERVGMLSAGGSPRPREQVIVALRCIMGSWVQPWFVAGVFNRKVPTFIFWVEITCTTTHPRDCHHVSGYWNQVRWEHGAWSWLGARAEWGLGPWCNCWRGYQVESKIPGEFSVRLKNFFTECSNSWLPDQNNVKQRNEVRFFMEILLWAGKSFPAADSQKNGQWKCILCEERLNCISNLFSTVIVFLCRWSQSRDHTKWVSMWRKWVLKKS